MDQRNIKAKLWQGSEVHQNYGLLQQILKKKNPFYDASTKGSIDQENDVVRFENIPKEKRGPLLEKFKREVEFLESKINQLKSDTENFNNLKNARLLEQCATYLDANDVYLVGDKLKLNKWGYDTIDSNNKKTSKKLHGLIKELNDIHNRPEFDEELNGDVDWKKVIQGVLAFLLLSLAALLCFKFFTRSSGDGSGQPHIEISQKEQKRQNSYADSRVYLTPIDTADVIAKPDDSLQLINIIGTQLNVFLNKNDNLDSIAKVIEQKYSELKIKGRDPNYQQLILEMSAGDRIRIKKDLQLEFPDFLVVDESVFRNNNSYDDPQLADKKISWYLDVIGAKDIWKSNQGSKDVIIAIIDDAFDIGHPELKSRIVKPWNVWKSSDEISPGQSWLNHGTHVAACAAGEINNGEGISGVAPNCSIMPIQVGDDFGNMSLSAILKGIMYAYLNGADVINLSIGTLQLSNFQNISESRQKEIAKSKYLEEEEVWKRIFERSKQYECIVVQAAGNSSCLASIDPMKRDTINSIIVAASDIDAKLSSFSSYGEMCKIVAPGSDIYNAVPGNKYQSMDGTSMASPLVAGAVALLKSQDDKLTLYQILQKITENGKRIDSRVGPVLNLKGMTNKNPANTIKDLKVQIKDLKQKLNKGILSLPINSSLDSHMNGVWISKGSIIHPVTGESVDLVYSMDSDLSGIVTIRMDNNSYLCEAKVDVSLDNNALLFKHSDFICDNNKTLIGHDIVCKSNSAGQTQCFFANNGKNQSLPFQIQKI